MNNDCIICDGSGGLHNEWLGKPCPRAPLVAPSGPPDPLLAPAIKDLAMEALHKTQDLNAFTLSGSEAAREVAELERLWRLKR